MPSGGGSAGGGGGGGGGGFGGEGEGFSSDTPSSSRYSSSTYTTSRSSDKDSSCGMCIGVVVGVVVTLFVLFVLGMIIGLSVAANSTGESNDDDSTVTISTDFYSPGDSRLLSLSSFFCDGGSLELSSNSVDAELFLIDDTSIPALNDTNQFTVSIESTIDSTEFRFWQYHLYPNSNISVSVCTDLLVDVYIVKGNDNANSWANNPSQDLAEMFQYAPACCNDLPNTSTISYRVEQEDEYYVILHNSLSMEISVNASLYFERTEYSAPDLNSKDSCNVSEQGNCLVGIDYSTGSQQFLVITSIPERVDWGENVRVSLICDQRGWAYAVVILVPISVIFALIVAVVLGIVCCCKCSTTTESANIEMPRSDFPPTNNSGSADKIDPDFNPDYLPENKF